MHTDHDDIARGYTDHDLKVGWQCVATDKRETAQRIANACQGAANPLWSEGLCKGLLLTNVSCLLFQLDHQHPILATVSALGTAIAVACVLDNRRTERRMRELPTPALAALYKHQPSAGFIVPGAVRRISADELARRAFAAHSLEHAEIDELVAEMYASATARGWSHPFRRKADRRHERQKPASYLR